MEKIFFPLVRRGVQRPLYLYSGGSRKQRLAPGQDRTGRENKDQAARTEMPAGDGSPSHEPPEPGHISLLAPPCQGGVALSPDTRQDSHNH